MTGNSDIVNRKPLRPGSAATSLTQDVLGRRVFVENLAAAIRNYGSADSLTIGLYGPWGSGKSSLLNFVIEELENAKDTIAIARFNPWNFSQQDRLFSAFFAAMSSLIKRSEDSREAKKIAAWLDTFAAATAPVSLVGLGFIPEAAKQLSSAYGKFAEEWGDVEARKSDISKFLTASKKRYVVVIDDIDRLLDTEVRQIFQLIKSMADFQNVIYVLAFDREAVTRALADMTSGEGEAYLEKIINVPITIPTLTARQVRQLFIAELNAFAERQRPYEWNNERLKSIIDIGVKNFSTVRQIERFANALTVLEGLTVHDVDFTDHIAMTILKSLEPSLYDFIGNNAVLFIDDMFNQLARPKGEDQREKSVIDDAFKKLKLLSNDDTVLLLGEVFPKIKRLYAQHAKSNHWIESRWRIDSRACADFKTFSRYFTFRVDEGDISAKDREKLWESSKTVQEFERFIKDLGDVERIHRMLEYIGDLDAGEMAPDQIEIVIESLIDIGDQFAKIPDSTDLFFGPMDEALNTCNALIESLPSERHFEVVMTALRRPPTSIEMPVAVVQRLDSSRANAFTKEQLRRLSSVVLELFEAAWNDDRLLAHKRNLYLVTEWLNSAGEAARDTIRKSLDTDDAKFSKFLSLYENVQTDASYYPHRFYVRGIASIYDLEELKDRLGSLVGKTDGPELQRLSEILSEINQTL